MYNIFLKFDLTHVNEWMCGPAAPIQTSGLRIPYIKSTWFFLVVALLSRFAFLLSLNDWDSVIGPLKVVEVFLLDFLCQNEA